MLDGGDINDFYDWKIKSTIAGISVVLWLVVMFILVGMFGFALGANYANKHMQNTVYNSTYLEGYNTLT